MTTSKIFQQRNNNILKRIVMEIKERGEQKYFFKYDPKAFEKPINN